MIKILLEIPARKKRRQHLQVPYFCPGHLDVKTEFLTGVRFWGNDSAMEATSLVTEDALKRVQPDVRSDATGLLHAFDSNRDAIHEAAYFKRVPRLSAERESPETALMRRGNLVYVKFYQRPSPQIDFCGTQKRM
jgi:Protein of unknown function (DUF1488)